MPETPPYAAVILAGGAGRRLAGSAKPALPVAGRPMLQRVLAAATGARPRIVVGPPELALPAEVTRVQERPPGGGPAAAAAAGLALLPPETGYVLLLAADLPLLTGAALQRLRRALADDDRLDGAVYVDGDGRPQWLCGAWRAGALAARRARLPADLDGAPIRQLLGGLALARLAAAGQEPPPWWDCDTETDLRQAEQWVQQTEEYDDGGVG